MTNHRTFVLFYILLFFALSQTHAAVSMSSLQNLPEVGINVRPISEAAEDFDLTENQVSERVRSVLAKTNLRIATDPEAGVPEFRVSIRLAHVRGPSHLYVVEIELVESVTPERTLTSLETIPATTWQRLSLGIANSPRSVLSAVDSMAKIFAEEHQAEN